MRAIESYLRELPEPYRTVALRNRSSTVCRHRYTRYAEDHAQAILKAFNWNTASENPTYWSNLHENLKQRNIRLNIVSQPLTPLTAPLNVPKFQSSSKRAVQVYNDLMEGKELPARTVGESHMSIYVNMLRKHGIPVLEKRVRDIKGPDDKIEFKVFYLDPDYIGEHGGLQQP
jgi:hypothetical protein